jgi:arginine decarboxylase
MGELKNLKTLGLVDVPGNGRKARYAPRADAFVFNQLLVPKRVFFTKGIGSHRDELRSFELALRDAGIEKCNLVNVSSILPPGCRITPRSKGLEALIPGQILFCVMSRCCSNEPRRLMAASVGCAVPTDANCYGYLSEHHSFGQTGRAAGDYAEDMAAAMLASTLGIEFDEDQNWDEKKEVFRISDQIVRTSNITQSGIVENGKYTSVMAAAVFLFD